MWRGSSSSPEGFLHAIALAGALLALTGCAVRDLTPAERAFLETTHGTALDAGRMRITDGALVGHVPMRRPPRPQVACRERIWPPETGETVTTRVAGMVLYERLLVARWLYTGDFLAGYPEALPLADAMFLAHEATHVWQWQARAQTGYAPWKAAAEHTRSADPYLFEVSDEASFFDFGYEQQASVVEEYVCCRALDPEGARTARLRDILRPVFPTFAEAEAAQAVRLPWDGADTAAICS